MRTLFVCLLFLNAYQGVAQNDYHIIYTTFYPGNPPVANELIKSEFKNHLVFNDSFSYLFHTRYGKPNHKKRGIYGLKPMPHTSYYAVKNEQWYDVNWNVKKKKITLQKYDQKIIDWHIQPDSVKTILGYKCTKAWGLKNGALIYIWFTTEIPFFYGPIPFIRYPGTALEVFQFKNGNTSVATKITKGNYPIALPKIKILEHPIIQP